ncbi:Cyclic di-GMP phosphodiesterase response regulator RpfG [Caloramator mitchellensis]|uniref:Cyclic di-GMP phosphodiesterase response regulator RpfG n=1 Tax=Caloramator mitchellensis TaxID=908809 RepID=A0A0R3JWE7_CALMK|nr:HD domain-containing phosphohydrolase [Caloramator mitchellensis]KRQ87848.1 Cyclic di-GMP phosphodiesterase response regulator RpfG [Caloramator mitchellensis]
MKIKRKLTIGILLIPTILLLFFTFSGYLIFSEHLQRMNEDRIKKISIAQIKNIDYAIEDIKDDIFIYINNIEHKDNLYNLIQNDKDIENYLIKTIILDSKSEMFFQGDLNNFNELRNLNIDFQNVEISNFEKNNFAIILSFNSKNLDGKLIFVLSKILFEELLSSIEIEYEGYAYLVDSNGYLLYHPDSSKLGTMVSNAFINGMIDKINKGSKIFIDTGYYYYNNEYKFSLANYNEKYKIYYVIAQNVKEIKYAAYANSISILILGVVIISFTLFVGRYYLKSITKPLDKLTKIIDDTTMHNIAVVDFNDKDDEISKLYNVYNEMTIRLSDAYNELESLYEEIYAQDEELKSQYDELMKSEKNIRELYEYLKALFDNSPDAIVHFDKEHKIIDVNPAFEELFGYSKEECLGRNVDEIVIPKELKEIAIEVTNTLFYNGHVLLEGIRYNREGKQIYVHIKGLLIKINNEVVGGYAIYTDFSESKKYQERLEYLSLHDALTGVYNLAFFQEELKRFSKSREYPITIVMADLNGLKLVNDTLGHLFGDKLIMGCAEAIKKSLRSSDIIARTGGDEFAIILPKANAFLTENILRRIKHNIDLFNEQNKNEGIILSVSFGFATANEAKNLMETFRDADEAMYKNKLLDNFSLRRQTLSVLLATLAEKDFITKGHTDRVKELCEKVGKEIELPLVNMANLMLLAEVHDLGKIAIPDSILLKPDKLTEEEWKIMKQHPEKGYRIALSSTDLSNVAELILKHHERYDGKGYPLGLKKDDIPIECRILAVVDAFDAMTNVRPYNRVKTKEEALMEIKRCSGTQFDPDIVNVFLRVLSA